MAKIKLTGEQRDLFLFGKNSILLIVIISYQNTNKYKAKAWNCNNEVMKNWLCVRNILFCDTVLKVKLCEITDVNSHVLDPLP
jgi:hypothetical protein